jgi:hypothetical protein
MPENVFSCSIRVFYNKVIGISIAWGKCRNSIFSHEGTQRSEDCNFLGFMVSYITTMNKIKLPLPQSGGYVSKCDICFDIRRFLFEIGKFDELRPREFYLHSA